MACLAHVRPVLNVWYCSECPRPPSYEISNAAVQGPDTASTVQNGDGVEEAIRRKAAQQAAAERERLAKQAETADRLAELSREKAARAATNRALAEQFVRWALRHGIPFDYKSFRIKGWAVSRYDYVTYGSYDMEVPGSTPILVTKTLRLFGLDGGRPVPWKQYDDLKTEDFEEVIAEQVLKYDKPWEP